ncbi:uncharacterized protein BJ212DRAFT_1486739 [Suillus subaureus]|uniref:Uncharacterized protein n=1 Tax=Suillus subaureus TaxID=48587 RepID=A0A9P7J5V2_9AGAM|nr:uncharacterized protein BJ212DRAFT_1486739 [Suillus subaureus]KAG1804318.1 hypothetical protein BJ212DRAFT_1486739 [Suillus subaureus]
MLQCTDELPPQIELLDSEDEEVIPLLDNYQDLPAHEESNNACYMGGVNGGLSMDTGHHHQLDILEWDNEPELTGAKEAFGLDDAGVENEIPPGIYHAYFDSQQLVQCITHSLTFLQNVPEARHFLALCDAAS